MIDSSRFLLALISLAFAALAQERSPNIVVILADDLGIGDARCYNPESKIPTPRLDALAESGVRCTDAHSPSAVCSPTRYALLTGRYAWRSRLKSGVLWGRSRLLLEPGRATLASMLGECGYHTACIGKWHLGLGEFDDERPERECDYGQPLDAGPHTVGFDEVLVIPASLDMDPYVYVEGDRVREAPTARTPGSERRWSGGGGFWRAGPAAPSFDFHAVLPTFTARAVRYVESRAEQPERPFFLYLPLPAPHTPWMPVEEFRGRSEAGWYGDFVAQVDASVGQVLDALDEHGFAKNTLVVVTSDNGSHWRRKDVEEFGHDAHLGFRGMKADVFEAGHRVPFLIRWPGRLEPGICDALFGLQDLYATFAALVDHDVREGEAEDSVDLLGAWAGGASARDELAHHSLDGTFAIRVGRFKLIDGLGSGGFTAPQRVDPEPGGPTGRLFDLEADPAESHDLFTDRPEVVERLANALRRIRS